MIPMHGRKAMAIVSLTMATVMAGACGRSKNTLAPSGPTPVGGTMKVAIEGQVNLSVGQTIPLFAFVTSADGTKDDVSQSCPCRRKDV